MKKVKTEIIELLIERATEKSTNKDIKKYEKLKQTEFNGMLETMFTRSDRQIVEELIFEHLCIEEDKGGRLYIQGLKDGIAILKALEVL